MEGDRLGTENNQIYPNKPVLLQLQHLHGASDAGQVGWKQKGIAVVFGNGQWVIPILVRLLGTVLKL